MLKQIVQLPFQSSVLIANVIFALFFSFFVKAAEFGGIFGIFILPAMLVFGAAYMQYCFDLGLQAAMGKEEPAVYRFNAINFQALAFTLFIILMYYSFSAWLGVTYARILIALIAPAMLSSMLIEQAWLRAINPINWLITIIQLKHHYLAISLVLYFGMTLNYFLQSDWFIVLNLFVLMTITTMVFFTIGLLLFEQRESLKIQAPLETSDFKQHSQRAEVEETFQHRSDSWHRMAKVREITKAMTAIEEYLATEQHSFQAYEMVMEELCSWQSKRLAIVYLDSYLPAMLKFRKTGLAYAKLKQLWLTDGPITIASQESRQAMIEFAQDSNDLEISDYLIESSQAS